MPLHRPHLLLTLTLTACTAPAATGWDDEAFVERAHAAVERYVHVVMDSYDDTITAAEAMDAAIDAFVAAPSEAGLAAARDAWLAARTLYGQTEAYRFYGGPIDAEPGGLEGQINSWPMDEVYIDYVDGMPDAGIINNRADYPTLARDLLIELNTAGSETDIATGWHAIEFLLWGQDLAADGPGARPWTDYVADGTGTAANQDRRGQYLTIVSDLLLDDLEAVRAAWDEGTDWHLAFEHDDPKASLQKILTGLGSLSGAELSGERMAVAYDTKQQEDEHSCFSDNTHNDLLNNAKGLQNVYLGAWDQDAGESLSTLVHALDPDLDTRMQDQLDRAIERLDAIPEPFDAAIQGADDSPGREAVAAAIAALKDLTMTTVEVATALDISLNLEQ